MSLAMPGTTGIGCILLVESYLSRWKSLLLQPPNITFKILMNTHNPNTVMITSPISLIYFLLQLVKIRKKIAT